MDGPLYSALPLLVGGVLTCIYCLVTSGLRRSEKLLLILVLMNQLLYHVLPAVMDMPIHTYDQSTLRFVVLSTSGVIFLWAVVLVLGDLLSGKLRFPGQYLFEKLLLIVALLEGMFATIGVLSGHTLQYVVSDTYKLLIPAAAYLVVLRCIEPDRAQHVLSSFYNVMILLCLTSLVWSFWLFSLGIIRKIHVLGVRMALPVLLVSLVYGFGGIRSGLLKAPAITRVALTLAALASVAISLERALWVGAVVGVLVLLLVLGKRAVFGSVIGFTMLLGVWLMLSNLPVFHFEGLPGEVLEQAVGRATDGFAELERVLAITEGRGEAKGSLDQKVAEVVDAFAFMRSQGNPLHFLVGMGNGAEYPLRVALQTSGDSDKGPEFNRTIHFEPMDIFFRRGAIGLLAYLLVYISLFGLIGRVTLRGHGDRKAIGAAYLSTAAIMLLGTGVLWDLSFLVYSGLVSLMIRQTEIQKAGATGIARWSGPLQPEPV